MLAEYEYVCYLVWIVLKMVWAMGVFMALSALAGVTVWKIGKVGFRQVKLFLFGGV